MKNYLHRAIVKLNPNAEFSITNDDYSTIQWVVLEGEAPTQAQIDAAIKQIKLDDVQEAETRAALKASALAKLAALGLTEDEAKAVIGV